VAFKGKETRKKLVVKQYAEIGVLDVPIERMILKHAAHTVYFKRLGYKYCPGVQINSAGLRFKLKRDEVLVDMNRWEQVRELYSALVSIDRSSRTKINIFNALVSFVRNSDENSITDIFSKEAIASFVSFLKKRYRQGVKGKTLNQLQSSIKSIFYEMDFKFAESVIGDFISFPNDTDPVIAYTDTEVKEIVLALYKIFNSYSKSVLNNTIPSEFPLYDENKLIELGKYSYSTKSSWLKKIGTKNNVDTWKNDLVKSAFYLTSFYTGANETALINLKHSDVSHSDFRESSKGTFILSTVKNRQNNKVNILEVGFSSRAKEFFENWLIICEILLEGKSKYVFPKIINGTASKFNPSEASGSLNHSFSSLGLPTLSTQKFRKTKATLIMRATESIFSVAEGLSNSVTTVNKHYMDGDPLSSRFSLAQALHVRHQTATTSASIKDILLDNSYAFSDPIRVNYLKNNCETRPHVLLNGLSCKDSFGEKAKRLKSSLVKSGIANQSENVACSKVFECFRCEHHAIIAEADDIWLMLSFRDVILELSCRPSINTLPTNTVTKVLNTLEIILDKLKNEYFDNYSEAYDKYQIEPHPLWRDTDDLENIYWSNLT
jgi:hypothetical protein